MVLLSLLSPKGNQAVRYFPHYGYLGLTPVKVEGVVRTKIEEDGKPLQASVLTISVRCYESRLGRVNAVQTNCLADFTQILWSKPTTQNWGELGDAEFPFRITIPSRVGGYSTANFQDYRISWRIEADLRHMPMGSVGSRQVKHFDMALTRHDLPPNPSTPSSPTSYLGSQTDKPRAPVVRYRMSVPSTPVGPQDLVSIPITLQPLDPAVTIRSASVIIERRIAFSDISSNGSSIPIITSPEPSSPLASPVYSPTTPPYDNTPSNFLRAHSEPAPSASPSPATSTVFSDTPLLNGPLSPTPTQSKTITHSVAGVESAGRFARDDDGIWTKTLTLQWPSAKSNARWAMGETIQTDLASVRFFARSKIIVSSPSGTESIDLAEQELTVVSTNASERQIALAKYNELLQSSLRSKSKSPRRSRRDREPLPSPPQSPPGTAQGDHAMNSLGLLTPKSAGHEHYSSTSAHPVKKSVASSPYGPKKKKSMRRPHTSAGPRDKSNEFQRELAPYERKRPDEEHPFNDDEVMARGIPNGVVDGGGGGSGTPSTTPNSLGRKRMSVSPVLTSNTSTPATRAVEIVMDPNQVRAWEEELLRIEVQSRRSSRDMLGVFKRKRAA